MKAKIISETTTNRYEFNRSYKHSLANKRIISCSYCRYHRGENRTNEYYGGYEEDGIKYPNWKLVSKNKKQWMVKTIVFKREPNKYRNNDYIKISF